MAIDLSLKPAGLVTDPAPTSSAPDGALREASNVVINRQGIVEPRPGFKNQIVGLSLPSGVQARFAVPFDDDLLIWGYHTGSSSWRIYRASDLGLVSSGVTPPDPNRRRTKSFEARGNLYFTSTTGVMKLTGAAASTTLSGLFPPRPMADFVGTSQGLVTGAGITGALRPLGKTAYRLILRREDANGYQVRSFPSNRTLVTNPGGTQLNVAVGIAGLPNAQVGDVVEVYRSIAGTPSATFVPSDVMYLATEYALTSADVTALAAAAPPNQKLTIIDATPEGYMGAEIYTSPGQRDLVGGKRPPPLAREVCYFRGSAFYFDIQSPHRVQLRVAKVSGNTVGGFYSSSLTGIQARAITGDYMSGSVTVQSVSNMNGLAVGMGLARADNLDGPRVADSVFPANTWIASLGSSRVRMTAAALSSTTALSTIAHERISIGGVHVYGHLTNNAPQKLGFWTAGPSAGTPTASYSRVASDFSKALNSLSNVFFAEVATEDGGGSSNIFIERASPRDLAFSVSTSRSGAFAPVITAGMMSESDIEPGGYAWSDVDEPEAVPITNYAVVGDPNERVLRAIPTRDVLYIFKETGLWALTGEGAASGWRVDPIDPSFKLVAPDTCAVLDEKVYCLSDGGVVAVSQAGIEALSEPYIGVDLRGYTASLSAHSASAHVPSAIADHIEHRYIIGLGPPGASNENADLCYVWNEKTRTWTTWALTPKHIAVNVDDSIALVYTGTFQVRQSRRGDTFDLADESYQININAVVASLSRISFDAGSGWSPAVGDLVKQVDAESPPNNWQGIVESVYTSTTVALSTSVAQTGGATAYTSFESAIEWTTRTAGNPTSVKAWSEMAVHFLDTTGLQHFSLETQSDISPLTSVTQTISLGSMAAAAPLSVRAFIPRAQNYSTDLFVRLVIRNAGAEWKAAELAIQGQEVSMRNRRNF